MRPCASDDEARTEHAQATITAKHSEMALVFEELNIISWAVQALRITALVLQTPQHLRTSRPVAAGRQQGHILLRLPSCSQWM